MNVRRAAPALVVAGCLGAGSLTLLFSAMPHYDAWGWIVWGREIADPHRMLGTLGGPAWKPLPVLFTTLFAPLGGAAPALWLVVSRAGGALALVLAFLLGRRLGGVAAGLLAAGFLALSEGWMLELAWGAADPLLVAAVLGAVLCHLDGRHERALLAMLAAALVRPEAWPFLGLYAVWAWRTRRARAPVVAGLLLAVPVLWLGPDWYSSGDPFTGSRLARHSIEARQARHDAIPILGMLRRTAAVLPLPIWIAAAAGVALGVWRRERVLVGVAAVAAAWIALVAFMTLFGYAGLGRFSLAAAALACVLAGVALVRAVALAPGRPAAIVA
ncbi:MAG: hypothetical protein QOK31_1725, partial [Solirubrobacteraceae bacterium]|nr:hypothetical protein [Solirubrobacteraceae bacterium]